jgi:hypothetical protein
MFVPPPANGTRRRASSTSLGSICLGSMLVAMLQTLRSLIQLARGHRVLRMFAEYVSSFAFSKPSPAAFSASLRT